MYFSVTIVFSPVSISGIIHGKKKKKSLSLLELRFYLKFYLWGIGEKIGRNVELDHKNISRCSTTTNY